ncbi:MAG: threonine dehydratase [Burkholderiaceae bacterium]|jgi:threonine dehydratase|nr:threonine dehydratase [Burkholderiales bacterium]MCZ8099522.1 threonine dehydratase [Burkholderiales bacterium]MCZ8339562.1 threonine dehydratase [Burkholderiaceae bacterium]
MDTLPSLDEIESAAALVRAAMPPTPQYPWPLLARRLGAEVWVKHENHTPTGAFKVRGGLVYLDGLARREPGCPGIVSATRGNHGQSLAFAARRVGVPVTIVVPCGNSVEKNAAMRAFGAELVEHGEDFQDASEHAARLAAERGLHRVPSFHRDLVRGVATYWLELFRAVPDLELAFVPIGLGSGLCGALAAREALGARVRIVGVVSAHAPAYARSIAAGRPVDAPVSTRIADGMACRVADPTALSLMIGRVDEVIEVDDDEVERAMKALYVDTHNVAEGAGAASLAAAMRLARERPDAVRGRRVGVTLCGGNVDHDAFARVLLDTALD